jgi:magnesium-transporting ATPase (P-type)
MMSVVVEGPDGQRELLTKGAPEAVFAKCLSSGMLAAARQFFTLAV